MRFLIVDDRSTDETLKILRQQSDVTVFQPVKGSNYSSDKAIWRSELLDKYGDNAWCLVPDIDEHFVYDGMERKSLLRLIEELEREGSDALATIMIDMYADKPLIDHVYTGGGLLHHFPCFDGPAPHEYGYCLWLNGRRGRRKFPTPEYLCSGGMRERLFFGKYLDSSRLQRYFINHFSHLDRPLNPGKVELVRDIITRRMIKGLYTLNQMKLGLLRWRKGMRFSGGAHRVSEKLRLSESIAAFLHFKFTQGVYRLQYNADRGQHTEKGIFYKSKVKQPDILARSPVCEATKKYQDTSSLVGIIRSR